MKIEGRGMTGFVVPLQAAKGAWHKWLQHRDGWFKAFRALMYRCERHLGNLNK